MAVAAALLLAAAGAPPARAGHAPAPGIEVTIVAPPGQAPTRPVYSEDRLRRILRPLLGSGCDATSLEGVLERRYKFLGYLPAIEIDCSEAAVRVRIRESSHTVDLVTFDPADLARIGVAPHEDFEEKLHLYPVPPDAPRAVLRSLLLTHEGDLYNFERYRADREAVAKLGYAVAFIPGTTGEGSDYPRGAYLLMSLTPRAPGAAARRKTNYIGGTGSYGPRQKGAAGLLYEKDALFGEADRLSLAPTYSAAAGGSLSYFAPLLARRVEPRRLYDLELRLFSDFTHNRQLDAVETDQRQTGLSGTIGIRPLHLKPPHALRLEIGLSSERIRLSQTPPGEDAGSTDSFRLGATYDWLHTHRWPSLSLRVAPLFDFSLRARGGERTFVRAGLDATLHARTRAGPEIEIHAVGGTIDRHVPSFEQWSLGGPTTVRGFREDSFLGRHLAALQTEIWFPFVRSASATAPPGGREGDAALAPFEPRAARLLKWALFADGGRLADTTGGTNETIAGAGLGIRFLVPHHPFVVKVDYGWGLGARGGDAFPYVSLVYRY
jgi:outer membrane protein assembly factor BamA